MPQSIHFISVGGSAMHSLAIALQQQGYHVTGSDDDIYEPSRTQLAKHNLLPNSMGWFPEKIHPDLTAVIVGMHARRDNAELAKALQIGIPAYSYPEFIYQQSQQKQRVVIAGSHGKTTITSIICHVLRYHNRTFDYLAGAQIQGFETTIKLTADAPLIIIEGDEYASSPLDSSPKFLHYKPHIALISGIAWDHVNIYPTWDEYVDQFELLAEAMPKAGILIFDESDNMLDIIGQKERPDITKVPYEGHNSVITNGETFLVTKQGNQVPVSIFGKHNMKNIAGAMTLLDRIGVTEEQFYAAISTFKGTALRLENVAQKGHRILFRDVAHSPSKVQAATEAVKQQYPGKKLVAAVELHTFSSLDRSFLDQYHGCLDIADKAIVYFNAQALVSIRTKPVTKEDILSAFNRPDLLVFDNPVDLQAYLIRQHDTAEVFLLMSSGTFGGLDMELITKNLI